MRGLAIAAVVLFGCASETGVMLVISTADGAAQPDEIIVFVGGADDEISGVAAETFNDPDSDRFEVDGDRDLGKDPIRYLIRPDNKRGGAIRVAAVGLGREIGAPLTAHYADSLEFAPEVVLEIELELAVRETEELDECTLCFSHFGDDGYAISSHLDVDCDQSRPADSGDATCDDGSRFAPPDCDDRDAARSPTLIESCDGLDNDCDQVEQIKIACFIPEADACRIGTQACDGGGWSECEAEGDPDAETTLCETLADCRAADDPIECFGAKHGGRIAERDCDVSIDAAADLLCSTGTVLPVPANCTEMVVLAIEGPPNASGSLSFGESGPAGAGTATECEGEPAPLVLGGDRGLGRGARVLVLERNAGADDSVLHVINLEPKYVESCGDAETPVTCVSR